MKHDHDMRPLLLICAGLLLFALADLPIGYYTLLRIVIPLGSVSVVITEYEDRMNFWVIAFGLITILFNPVMPVYLGDKSAWAGIDSIAAILFIIKALNEKKQKT